MMSYGLLMFRLNLFLRVLLSQITPTINMNYAARANATQDDDNHVSFGLREQKLNTQGTMKTKLLYTHCAISLSNKFAVAVHLPCLPCFERSLH